MSDENETGSVFDEPKWTDNAREEIKERKGLAQRGFTFIVKQYKKACCSLKGGNCGK